MSQSPRPTTSSTSPATSTRRAGRTDAAVIAQYIQDLWAAVSRPAAAPC